MTDREYWSVVDLADEGDVTVAIIDATKDWALPVLDASAATLAVALLKDFSIVWKVNGGSPS